MKEARKDVGFFRGLCSKSGKMVKGNLLQIGEEYFIFVVQKDKFELYPIIPGTISEFTGFYDTCGHKIFENDFTENYFDDDNPEDICYSRVINYQNMWVTSESDNLLCPITEEVAKRMKVVSYIYDLPEKGEKND